MKTIFELEVEVGDESFVQEFIMDNDDFEDDFEDIRNDSELFIESFLEDKGIEVLEIMSLKEDHQLIVFQAIDYNGEVIATAKLKEA